MKIRSDFVTNSSSSSFTRTCIFDDDLFNFIEQLVKQNKYLQKFGWLTFSNNVACCFLELINIKARGQSINMIQIDDPCAFSDTYSLIHSFFNLEKSEETQLQMLLEEASSRRKAILKDRYWGDTDGGLYNSQLDGPTADLFRRIYGSRGSKFITHADKKKTVYLDYYNGLDEDVRIPEDISIVGPEAFTNSIEMQSLYIPKGVKEIDEDTFIGCRNLKKITIEPANPRYTSGENCNCIIDKTSNKLILATDINNIPDSVRILGKNSVANILNDNKKVTIPSNITVIEDGAFRNCSYSAEITIESTSVTLGEKLFDKNNKNTLFFKSGSLKSVPADYKMAAFDGFINNIDSFDKESKDYMSYIEYMQKKQRTLYESVKEHEIFVSLFIDHKILPPEKVDYLINKIGTAKKRAHLVEALKAYRERETASNGTAIDRSSSEYIKKTWRYSQEDDTIKITGYKGSEEEIVVPDHIGKKTVAAIGPYAFSPTASRITKDESFYRKKVRTIVIPASVKTIEDGAFCECKNLKQISISEGVESIGRYAFKNCKNIEELTFPASLSFIGDSALAKCSALKKLTFLSKELQTENRIFCDESPSFISAGPIGCGCDYSFSWDKNIPAYAFANLSTLETVIIPSTILSIGESAFFRCENLKGVDLPDHLTAISKYLFYNCTSLRSLSIPHGVLQIGYEAFSSTGLKELIIPEGTIRIEDYAFSDSSELEHIKLPESLKEIGNGVFCDCEKLRNVDLPNGLTQIGRQGSDWKDICNNSSWDQGVLYVGQYIIIATTGTERSIVIHKGTKLIADWAFTDVSGIKEISFPAELETIGINAFHRCPGINRITVDPNNKKYDSRNDCNAVIETEINKLILGCNQTKIPEDIVSIGKSAFSTDDETNIYIPPAVRDIDSSAFDYDHTNPSSYVISGIKGTSAEEYSKSAWHCNFLPVSE